MPYMSFSHNTQTVFYRQHNGQKMINDKKTNNDIKKPITHRT